MKSTNNQPIEKYTLGRLSLAVWENRSDDGETYYKVTLDRRYRDAQGTWQTTNAFGIRDLPALIVLIQHVVAALAVKSLK